MGPGTDEKGRAADVTGPGFTIGEGRRPRSGRVTIEVFDNQIEPALKALKKQMLNGGIFKEMKRRAYYEKPSVKRKRKWAEARRRRRKALRRTAGLEDRDG